MVDNGWIKIHRKLLENPIIMKDADHLAVWVYLLLNATHAEYPALFKGQKIILQPGQLIAGRKSIASKLDVNESKVRRILDCFESDQQIDRQRSNQNTLITLTNWEKYQLCDQQINQQMTNQRPTNDQPPTTNKNVKNVKNVINNNNNNISCAFSDEKHDTLNEFFESIWKLYPIKKGKGQISKTKKQTLQRIGYEQIKRCVDRFVEDMESSKRDKQYWMHGSTFFNSGYVDYLDENYEKGESDNEEYYGYQL